MILCSTDKHARCLVERKKIRDHIGAPAKLLTATVASWQSDRSHVQNFRDQRRRRFRFRDGEKAEPAPARTSRSPGGEMDDSWRVTCSVNFSPLPSYPIWSCPGHEWSGHLLICIICLACAAQVALGLGQDLARRIDPIIAPPLLGGWIDRFAASGDSKRVFRSQTFQIFYHIKITSKY